MNSIKDSIKELEQTIGSLIESVFKLQKRMNEVNNLIAEMKNALDAQAAWDQTVVGLLDSLTPYALDPQIKRRIL